MRKSIEPLTMLTINQFRPYILRLMADGQSRYGYEISAQVIQMTDLGAVDNSRLGFTGAQENICNIDRFVATLSFLSPSPPPLSLKGEGC